MKLRIPLALAITVFFGLAVGLFYPWKNEGFYISEIGDYELKGDSHMVRVYMDDNEMLNLRLSEPGRQVEWGDGFIDPNKNWFIYVDKINEVWLSHEDEVSFHYSLEERSGSHSVNLYPDAKFKDSTLIELIPLEVINRLPDSALQALSILNSRSSF